MNREMLKLWSANGSILAAVNWSDAESYLKVALLALTFAYTLRRWYLAERGKKGDTEIIKRMTDE